MTVRCNRKYDVDEEARKLYKQDLSSVLVQFRRTPEYLKILQERAEDMRENTRDTSNQLFYHQNAVMLDRVMQILGVDYSASGAGLDAELTTSKSLGQFFRVSSTNFPSGRRDNSIENIRVKKLDRYHTLYTSLNVAERNSMRDLVFMYMGQVIHGLIKSLGSDDLPARSTRLPFGGDYASAGEALTTTTTEHVLIHEVTPTPEPSPEEHEESTAAHRLRHVRRSLATTPSQDIEEKKPPRTF